MKRYAMTLIIITSSFLLMNQAFAWHCGQRCSSSIFSGKLECDAYQLICIKEDSPNKITDPIGSATPLPDPIKKTQDGERQELQAEVSSKGESMRMDDIAVTKASLTILKDQMTKMTVLMAS